MDVIARVLDTEPVADLATYRQGGGGRGLAAAREGGDAALAAIEAAGLRGRGGAGFPTATKWRSVLEYSTAEVAPTVVVNAAEGEPGSFKDRAILRANPYRMLEGALIAASVIGADEVVVATKARFTQAIARLQSAIDETVQAGWAEGVAIDIVEGPDEYLFGEETALLEVVEGRRPFPRIAPPWRRGVDDPRLVAPAPSDPDDAGGISPPTLVNNVETLAHVAMILAEGPEWFRQHGTDSSPGTIVCTVSGDVDAAGVVEVPMGTPLGEVLISVGGDAAERAVAVLAGVSAPIIPFDLFDTPLTYEAMAEVGSGLGTGGFIVLGPNTDPVAVAEGVARFLSVESCGQCSPCKDDGLAIAEALGKIRAGRTDGDELQTVGARLATVDDGARCYLAIQHRQVVSSLMGLFPSEVAVPDPTSETDPPYLVAELADLVEGSAGPEAVLDASQATKQPDWSQDSTWSGKVPVERYDQQAAGRS